MSTNRAHLQLPTTQIADFCQRHHIRKLALFGSALHGAARPDSDLDVLVEFEPGHVPGLFRLAGMHNSNCPRCSAGARWTSIRRYASAGISVTRCWLKPKRLMPQHDPQVRLRHISEDLLETAGGQATRCIPDVAPRNGM
jgi:hypothetical protein